MIYVKDVGGNRNHLFQGSPTLSKLARRNWINYAGQFKKKVTLSHVNSEVTSEPTITPYTTIVRKTLKDCNWRGKAFRAVAARRDHVAKWRLHSKRRSSSCSLRRQLCNNCATAGGMSRTSSTYHPCQMIFKNWDSASSPLWQPEIGGRESGQKWTIGLTCAVWYGVPTLSACKVTYQNFETFPNYWCISHDFRLTGYFIINMWKCYLLFELPCMFWVVDHGVVKTFIICSLLQMLLAS
jgi:hypothetical protein